MLLFKNAESTSIERIDIARDFSRFPGGRYRRQGKWSGEEFRDDRLRPAIEKGNVVVELAGAYGYPSSFLEETFGGLVRKGLSADLLHERLKIEASDSAYEVYVKQAWHYISDAQAMQKRAS